MSNFQTNRCVAFNEAKRQFSPGPAKIQASCASRFFGDGLCHPNTCCVRSTCDLLLPCELSGICSAFWKGPTSRCRTPSVRSGPAGSCLFCIEGGDSAVKRFMHEIDTKCSLRVPLFDVDYPPTRVRFEVPSVRPTLSIFDRNHLHCMPALPRGVSGAGQWFES